MLYLLFQLGKERYALEAGQALEVIPYIALKKIPHAPTGVAGVINYRGTPLPAVDLCTLTLGRPARELWSTRIIIVKLPDPTHPRPQTPDPGPDTGPETPDTVHGTCALGLIVEHATGIIRREPGQFHNTGLSQHHTPYLGPVLLDDQGAIQLLHPEHLLTQHLRQLLSAGKAAP